MSTAATNHQAPPRKALTLLELLVVVAILLLVTVTAAPVLIPSDVQKVRDAAITVNSMISRVKAAAARDDANGAGLWLQPITPSSQPLELASGAVLDMFTSRPQSPYEGDDRDVARVYVYKPYGNKPIIFPADGMESESRFVTSPPPSMGSSDAAWSAWQKLHLLLFPRTTCPSVWELCKASSRASIRGGEKWDFHLLPSGSISLSHLPQPYRIWNAPPGPAHPATVADPEKLQDKDYNFRHTYWEYAGQPVANDFAYVGVLQPSVNLSNVESEPYKPPYAHWSAGDPTPADVADAAFQIDRPNTRSPTPPLSLPSGYAIDLKWSGWAHVLFTPDFGSNTGAPVMGGFVPLDSLDPREPVQLMFDGNGDLKEVVYRRTSVIYGVETLVDSYLTNLGDVYLLVGRADRCGTPFTEQDLTDPNVTGANWQYPDSRWIRISKTGGAVTISEPVPGARTLTESLKFALAGIAAGRG